MKVAIVYDRVNKWGGAERVLLALQKIFPDAVLFTSVYESRRASWAKQFIKVQPSFLQRSSFARSHHELMALLMPLAFESFDFSEYELVISVTSEAAKGIITHPQTKHVCICLTPTRYLWSGYKEYFSNPLIRFLIKPLIWYLIKWDIMAASRPDVYVAISKNVHDRIKGYYNRDSEIVYPSTDKFKSTNELLDQRLRREKYFLMVSRLSKMTPYKRVDLALKVANTAHIPLKIIGDDKGADFYKKMAGPYVQFLGKLNDEDLFTYYKNAEALIFPGTEDFGLVMIEAQLAGTPVIAYRKGGALEIVKEGETGEFFDFQTVDSLSSVLKRFDRSRYNTNYCIENGQRFSFEQFKKGIERIVSTI